MKAEELIEAKARTMWISTGGNPHTWDEYRDMDLRGKASEKSKAMRDCLKSARVELAAEIARLEDEQDQKKGFPQPRRQDGDAPCGECHLHPGETCDICGAIRPVGDAR